MSGRVSVLIPSRGERFLVPTVDDVLAKARGDLEVVVTLDGYWPDPPLREDPRVVVIHHGSPLGMRPSINSAAQAATGEFLLKADAHTLWAEGFDEALKANYHEDNWIVVPRRYALDPEQWAIDPSNKKYPVDYHYLCEPTQRHGDSTPGLHGTPWTQRRDARREIELDDEMTSQGSAWFMSRRHWDRLGPLEIEKYGAFWHEMQELGLKTWLGGGALKVLKTTFYAHLYKGARFGRGYSTRDMGHEAGTTFCTDYWMNDRWPERVRSLRWLIEKFAPVPTWPEDLDAVFPRATQVAVSAPTLQPVDVRSEPTHDGRRKTAPRSFASRVRKGFKRAHLAKCFAQRGFTKGAEIGVADGRFSEVLCQSIPNLELLCVDPWLRYPGNPRGGPQAQHDGNFAAAQLRLRQYNVTFLRGMSSERAADVPLGSLDFVYIDGNHEFAFVLEDLRAWSPNVRRGGIVAGHDFYQFTKRPAGVVEAVTQFIGENGIAEWWICDEREPSFWWVKP